MKQKAVLLLLIIFLLGCKSNESVLLRLKFKKDDEQTFIIHFKAKCSSSMYVDTRIEAACTADSVLNGPLYYLTSKINALKADINLNDPLLFRENVETHYDSRKSLADMGQTERDLDSKLDKTLSTYYNIAFSGQGEIVKPFTAYGKSVIQPFGPSVVQLSFPEKRVKVGDSWTVKLKSPLTNIATSLIANDIIFKYTINDIKKDYVLIDAQLDMDFHGDQSRHIQGQGKYTIDRATGRTLSGYISVPMNGCDEDALISIIKDTPQNFDF